MKGRELKKERKKPRENKTQKKTMKVANGPFFCIS